MGWRGAFLGLAVCACGGGDPAGDGGDAGSGPTDAAAADAAPPALSRLLYRADQDIDEVYELYLASFTDDLLGTQKVYADVDGRWVRHFAWSSTGDHVSYGVSEAGGSSIELWIVPVDGPTAGEPVRVALDLATSGESVVGSVHHVQWSPAGDRLAFLAEAETDGVSQLFLVEPGAEESPTPLTSGDVADFAWSPDGSMLAYRVDTGDEDARGLFMVAASGGEAAEVSDLPAPGEIAEPSWPFVGYGWSPDGRYIHYGADQDVDNAIDLYVAEVVDGVVSEAVRVSPLPPDSRTRVVEATWSPDGARLVFLVGRTADGPYMGPLYVVDFAGGGFDRRLVSGPIKAGLYSRWSPDSRWVAFHGIDEGPAELFAVDVTDPSAEPEQVNPPLPPDGEVSDGTSLCVSTGWSPSGPQLSYLAIQEVDELGAVYVSDLSSGSPAEPVKMSGEAVDRGGVACPLRWTPDGRTLAYVGDQVTDGVFELFAVNADDPGAPSTVSGEMVFDGDVRDIMFQTLDFAWSPAGDWIAYRADQDVNERIELYAARRARPGESVRVSSLVELGDVIEHAWAP